MSIVLKDNARQIAKDYLRDHGIKHQFIADKLGVTNATISSRLNGRLKFDANFAIAFSRALNITLDIFLK
ncbi:helix-turn-helix domain-containing protein [Lactobacillus intestinalis]|uniref:helix-turn-helix domain-containing protein n=1 Tax=Lactobacillus intestinalis TaxID=151781 RepID=UPI00070A76AD|nr:helix-turn-helix transcriptional regulator [Lactobacillus intestinalis]UTW41333.1 helix-turn-helix transcriptional regulator [Lactobacillus intestinalis]